MADDVAHQENKQRFVLNVDGSEAELTYRRQGRIIIFDHTGVPPLLRHRGLANRLAEAALNYAREQNLRVDPQCRFVAVYLKRHAEYRDLLKNPM
jgi:predicted GNAT family acetyltransferase